MTVPKSTNQRPWKRGWYGFTDALGSSRVAPFSTPETGAVAMATRAVRRPPRRIPGLDTVAFHFGSFDAPPAPVMVGAGRVVQASTSMKFGEADPVSYPPPRAPRGGLLNRRGGMTHDRTRTRRVAAD